MRIAWYSNHPTAPTGYGGQTLQVTRRLKAAGHEVVYLSNFGGPGAGCGMTDYEGSDVWPQGTTQYSTDVLDAQVQAIDPDFVITLYDVWVLQPEQFKGVPTLSWVPVDHYPASPKVVEWLKGNPEMGARPSIAMTEYGQRQLQTAGITAGYIPHAIEAHFRPTPSDIRKRMEVPEDAFLIGINAANIGIYPPRKAWIENLMAVSALMRAHEDAYVYIHTDLSRSNGLDLKHWIGLLDLPTDRVRVADPLGYRTGNTSQTDLAELYTGMDVLLAASAGEGFGIPVVEAMACGTPAIVTDFSAQPELVGDTGWKVEYQLQGDLGQGAFLALPFVSSITKALEESYAERGSAFAGVRSERAIVKAADYGADKVFAEKWVPMLATMETAHTKMRAQAAGIALPSSAQPINTATRPKADKRKRKQQRRRK